MVSAASFESVGASVLPSGDSEVLLSKQAAVADHSHEVRSALSQLSPDVSRDLVSTYREPSPRLIADVEIGIISRELAIDHAQAGVGLDQEWLQGAQPATRDKESVIGTPDDWNTPAGP